MHKLVETSIYVACYNVFPPGHQHVCALIVGTCRPQFEYKFLCSLVHLSSTPPQELIMTEYSKHKRDGSIWYSAPFYSGPGGYKMCLCVTNDHDLWFGDRLMVYVYLMRGEYDDRLVWPLRGCITIQVVNQIDDQKHQERTLKLDRKSSISSCSRVTSGDRAKSGCGQRSFLLDIRCVKDDCVRFRVTKVLVAPCDVDRKLFELDI